MEIYQDYLQKEMKVTNEQIIAINLEDYDFYDMNFMHISKNDYCQTR